MNSESLTMEISCDWTSFKSITFKLLKTKNKHPKLGFLLPNSEHENIENDELQLKQEQERENKSRNW